MMKDYIAFILTLILIALIFIGYSILGMNKNQIPAVESETQKILNEMQGSKINDLDQQLNPGSATLPNSTATDTKNTSAKGSMENLSEENQLKLPTMVAGKICFPSEIIPQIDIYLQNTSNKSEYKKITTNGESVFKFDNLLPGKYILFAYVKGDNMLKGAYTKAVPCGLTMDCDDHNLIEIDLRYTQLITYADICDWYTNKIPPRPDLGK